jgi:hypothetical protein
MVKSILCVGLLMAGFSMASAGPVFTPVGDTAYDFGVADQGAVVEHVFKFKNAGRDTLKIISVKGSCGCTKAVASAEVLAPGKAGEIKVSFNSKGWEGVQQKTVTVSTNDTANAKFIYRLTGTVVVPNKIAPAAVPARN